MSAETFRQYGNRLNLYLRRWTNPSDSLVSNSEFIQIMDKIVADQVISSLRDDTLHLKLLEQRWSTVDELMELADNMMVARSACRNRTSDNMPFEGSMITPGQGDPNTTTSRRVNSPGRPERRLRCYTCNEPGHLSYHCPNTGTINYIRVSDRNHHEEFIPVTAPELGKTPSKNESPTNSLDGAYFEVVVNGEGTLAYADSGASVSLISRTLVDVQKVKQLKGPMQLSLLDGSPVSVIGKTTCTLEVAGEKAEIELLVSEIPCAVLFGRDMLKKFALVLDLNKNLYWSEKQRPCIKIPLVWIEKGGRETMHTTEGAALQTEALGTAQFENFDSDQEHYIQGKITGYDTEIDHLVHEFEEIFNDKPGYCDWLKHEIDTGDAKPVRKGPYKLSPSKRKDLQRQITDMLDWGVIVPSTSEWCSPVIMVPKQDGSYRLAVDYRGVNVVTKPSNYPIPTIESILYSMNQFFLQ